MNRINWNASAPRPAVSPNTGAIRDEPMAVLHIGRSTIQDTAENIAKLREALS